MTKSFIPDQKTLPDLKIIVQTRGKKNGLNLTAQSTRLGFTKAWLPRVLGNRDQKISMIIGLSNLHRLNLLQIYLPLLDASFRSTDSELQLQKQIEQLKKELEQTARERDKYFDALAGKK